jgi:hypothetical protein
MGAQTISAATRTVTAMASDNFAEGIYSTLATAGDEINALIQGTAGRVSVDGSANCNML